jgi:hypothetical protein
MTLTASNGIDMNSTQISQSTAIPANTNAQSVGPISQLPGTTVTLAPGGRWMIL